jgi:hypothetical protein
MERWPSGLRRTLGKRVYVKSVPWVRIPLSPPTATARRPESDCVRSNRAEESLLAPEDFFGMGSIAGFSVTTPLRMVPIEISGRRVARRMACRIVSLPLMLLSLAVPMRADFRVGDLVASEDSTGIIVFPPGKIEIFRTGVSTGTLAAYSGNSPHGISFDRSINLYVSNALTIQHYDQAGQPTGTFGDSSQYGVPGQGQGPFSMAFDATGNMYVSMFGLGDRRLAKLAPNGSVLQVYDVPSGPSEGPWSIDLAADQCTMYYAVRFTQRIGRLNVCQNVVLGDLTASAPGSDAQAVRILSDGSVLAATREALVRLSATGQVINTYSVPAATAWSALALEISGKTFWAASDTRLYRFQLDSPGPLQGPVFTAAPIVTSLVTIGEPRAALAASNAPTLSSLLLVALAAALMVVSLHRLQ